MATTNMPQRVRSFQSVYGYSLQPITPSPRRDIVRPIGERLNRPIVPLGSQPDCAQ